MTMSCNQVAALLCLLLWSVGCTDKEDESLAVFRARVVPVLEARCAAGVCHGLTPGGLAAGEQPGEASYAFRVDAAGKILDVAAAHEASRAFINTAEDPRFSSLLRKPLAEARGGLAHAGGDNVYSEADPAWRALEAWILAQTRPGGEDSVLDEPSPAERYFADKVHPHLIARSCAVASCHGLSSFVSYQLHGGMPGPEGLPLFSAEMVRQNYLMSRRFLAVDGDPTQSRLLRKGLPLDAGGIVHRGGNRTFFKGPNDPAVEALVEWARMERDQLVGGAAPEGLLGLVYVRGPVYPESLFENPNFQPGTDLYLRRAPLDSSPEINLTAHLHQGQADIRHPVVSPDATTVAFTMRRNVEEGYQLYLLDLQTLEARPVTHDAARLPSGTVVANMMPAFGPAGELYFASNRHDQVAERGDGLDLSIYRLDPGTEEAQRLTFTPGPEINPRLFTVGTFQNYLVFAHRRAVGARDETIGFSFPVDLHVDYHIFFGVTAPPDHFLEFVQMPDGRALTIATHTSNVWSGGALAIVDRSLGPDLLAGQAVQDAALPAFARTYRALDGATSTRGLSPGGVYRDPQPLPDESFLVAWAPGPLDLADAGAAPRFRILRITLGEAATGCVTTECMPQIATRTTLIDAPHSSVHSPRPVFVRGVWPAGAVALDSSQPTLFSMNDAPVNQAILENLPPTGPRQPRSVQGARLIEALPDAARSTLGPHMPARILGEFELHADRSSYVEVPAQTPYRVQLLDEDGMVTGEQHNRWLFNWPGQHFPESIDRHQYDARCAGCHGSASGLPEEVFPTLVDVVSKATATLARYEDRNPRRAREPLVLGDATRHTVDFARHVQPLLDAHCVPCHGGQIPAGGLQLEGRPTAAFTASYEALLARENGDGAFIYVDALNTSARSSLLMQVVRGELLAGSRPDHPPLALEAGELQTLVRWIESGAHYRLPEDP